MAEDGLVIDMIDVTGNKKAATMISLGPMRIHKSKPTLLHSR